MSAKELKRPLIDQGDQSSPESLSTMQPSMDSDKSSLVYLLPSQPVTDPYTSDCSVEGKPTSSTRKESPKRMKLTQKNVEKSVILTKTTRSSELTAADVLFLFDLDYSVQPDHPVDVATHSTVEETLLQILAFVHNHGGCNDSENEPGINVDSDHTSKRQCVMNEKSVSEIYLTLIESCPAFSWMTENDDLDLKTCSPSQISKQREYFSKLRRDHAGEYMMGDSLKSMVLFVESIRIHYAASGFRDGDNDNVKIILRHLGQLTPWNSFHRHSGEGDSWLRYRVSEELASDRAVGDHPSGDLRVFTDDRDTRIQVCPHSVLGTHRAAKVTIQVYKAEGTTSTHQTKLKTPDKNKHLFSKPERKRNGILDSKYKTAACDFLLQFIPSELRADRQCMDTMLGQHVTELIAVACDQPTQPTHHSVGIFMKNEHLYFSRLVLSSDRLDSYSPRVLCSYYSQFGAGSGRVCFSNWCLDLTVAKHRIALVAFFMEFLR